MFRVSEADNFGDAGALVEAVPDAFGTVVRDTTAIVASTLPYTADAAGAALSDGDEGGGDEDGAARAVVASALTDADAAGTASALVDAAVSAAVTQLEALLLAGFAEVCPTALPVARRGKEAPRRTHAPAGPDVACHAAVAAWLYLRASAGPPLSPLDEREGVTHEPEPSCGLRVATRSALGSLRVRAYGDAHALAFALLSALPPAQLGALAADARAQPGGMLLFTTHAAFAANAAAGRLHCAACGRFYAGRRGLRDHCQVAHGFAYEDGLRRVADARRALVVLRRGGDDAQPALAGALALAAAAAARARDALPHAGLTAARDGDVAALRGLLAAGWRPGDAAARCVDRHGSGPLHFAAGGGHLCACELLVAAGVPPAARQAANGRTPLHWAARNGRLAVVRWLVERCGVDPGEGTRDGTAALCLAAWQGRLAVVRYLVRRGCAVNGVNEYGCNASQWVAQRFDRATAEWLLAAGLDYGAVNHNGHSALHKAAVKGQVEACGWLLSVAGLTPALHARPDGDGNTPAVFARAEGHHALARWLDDACGEPTAGAQCTHETG